jgi:hypothetical protein
MRLKIPKINKKQPPKRRSVKPICLCLVHRLSRGLPSSPTFASISDAADEFDEEDVSSDEVAEDDGDAFLSPGAQIASVGKTNELIVRLLRVMLAATS